MSRYFDYDGSAIGSPCKFLYILWPGQSSHRRLPRLIAVGITRRWVESAVSLWILRVLRIYLLHCGPCVMYEKGKQMNKQCNALAGNLILLPMP